MLVGNPWLPACMVLATVICLVVAGSGRRPSEGCSLKERVQRLTRKEVLVTASRAERVSPERRLLIFVGKCFGRLRLNSALEAELARADVLLRADEFFGAVVLSAIGGGCLGLVLFRSPHLALILAVTGGAIPLLILVRARGSRLSRFNARLPDALVLMASGLRAGFPFVQTLDMVNREIPGPVGREFGRTFREIQLGNPAEDALTDLTARVRSTELDLVVTAVLIQREVGGNLAEVLNNIAVTVRDRLRIRGEIRALTAQGRLSGWIVGLLPIAVAAIIAMVSPGYFNVMLESPGGKIALGVAALGELFGALIIKRIVSLES